MQINIMHYCHTFISECRIIVIANTNSPLGVLQWRVGKGKYCHCDKRWRSWRESYYHCAGTSYDHCPAGVRAS